ncbi:SDR family NAD(P)-dependent oxidoreductase [Mucilaginibacter terrae]|uniref:3-hydroxy acid dehydrogenase/malonic semialdehyde reductase n=1 Tax=Mucilaginibacter terrae TaxID=1955052 RepID=A0ABU3H0A2_9SPHI|nr:SDR family NAD(P)-dependent oxidoreductase [Mucilaginibacter terrae]MDT3405449.1 3-hydroxy acid dehydrogenase/malonic semialdehyde reductase [Mucilaginibacter terrae]
MNKVLITGATSGIGEACAHVFAENNYDLIITGRRLDRLEKLAAEIKEKHQVNVLTLNFDVRNREDVISYLGRVPAEWQQVDVLINNAGLSSGLEPFQDCNFDDWDLMVDTNVKGLLYVSKIVANWMIANKKGHIVNLSSIAGIEVYPNGNVYCASKHAVDALNKAMRIDLLSSGIRVTGIYPGSVETEFSNVRFKGDDTRAKKVYEGYDPLVAADIAETIFWTTSRSAHVNINELVIMPTAQATATNYFRKS